MASDFFNCEVDKNMYQYRKQPFLREPIPKFLNIPLGEGFSVSVIGNDTIYTSTKKIKYNIEIKLDEILLDKANNKLKLKGEITGAWTNITPEEYNVFIGERKDTIIEHFLYSNPHAPFISNDGKIIDSISTGKRRNIFLLNAKEFNVVKSKLIVNKNKMIFDIETLIDKRSVLIFSLSGVYSRIFEVGKLL